MKIAIVGNRTGWEEEYVHKVLSNLINIENDEIVSGGAKGVDTFAQNFAKKTGMKITILYPEPSLPRPQRYYKRNQDIVNEADKIIAFQGNKHRSGTQSTINRGRKKGIPVIVISDGYIS